MVLEKRQHMKPEKMYIIRSDRRSFCAEIKPNGMVMIRVPVSASKNSIIEFIAMKKPWIERKLRERELRDRENVEEGLLSENELKELTARARTIMSAFTDRYAMQLDVCYNKISIRHQHTCWGSCSAKGNLSYNCLLMLSPESVQQSVAAHEVCHLLQMNHGKEFYSRLLVLRPNYWEDRKWLIDNGWKLIARLPERNRL